VPYGGGTGLVGGQVSVEDPAPLILSLERMTRILDVSPDDNVLVAEAGAILGDIQSAAAEAGRLFPLTLASEGSCRIGGNLSTNAGGTNVLRYGNARDLCLGVEAVLPDGTIWNGLKRLRKDNTGYDLRDLLIGAEGTLGVITKAALKLFPAPERFATALVGLRDPAAAIALLNAAQARFGEQVSAFELIHRHGFDFIAETMPDTRLPWGDPPEWMALIDLGFGAQALKGDDGGDGLEDFLAEAFEAGHITDALIAQNAAQRQDFWTVRETIPLANRKIGAVYSHDIAVPVSRIPEMIAQGRARVAAIGPLRVNCFGHVGDGNLHFNIYPPKGAVKADWVHLKDEIKTAIYDLVYELGGSMSAEHGIGRFKLDDLVRYEDPAKLGAMRAIKAALDPLGIMNPGATVPEVLGSGRD